jgi:uncharacterized protein with HEPN domain
MRRICNYIHGLTYEQFMKDTRTQDAVMRNLEVIGEAVKRLSPELKRAHPEIPWREMARMRDKLIHHYFGVNYDVVWSVASQQIPDLRLKLSDVLASIE